MIGIRKKYKSRLIFRRNSNRILIREIVSHESWEDNYSSQSSISMNDTIKIMLKYTTKAGAQIKKICKHVVYVSDLLMIQNNVQEWLENNTNDRFAHIHLNGSGGQYVAFRSNEDAIYFKMVWG